MSNSQSTICQFVNKYTYPILLTLFVLWTCIGIFPLQSYETDGYEIILGCDVMYREGWSFPPIYSYEYRMQPLITILIVSLKHLMPFLTCEQIYSIMTVVSSLFFLIGCIRFAEYVTGASKTKILIAAMLLPEMYAIAMYPNSAIPSAACFLWGLILMSRERYWLSGGLFALAIILRLDITIVLPTVLAMFIYMGKSIKRSLTLSIIMGLGFVAAAVFMFWMTGAEFLPTYNSYQKWNFIITTQERVLCILGFYSLAYVVLAPLGLYVVIKKKDWRELFLIMLPIILLHSIYVLFGNASKHFLYNAPFVIILGIHALTWLKDKLSTRPILKWAVYVLVLLFMTISVRKRNLDMPWLQENPLHQIGMVTPFFSLQSGHSEYTVGLGAGYQLITNDECMLLTGHIFYPWYIHSLKQVIRDWREQQKAVLDQVPTSNILTFEWGASAPVSFMLMTEDNHFRLEENMPEEYRFTISNPQHELRFWRVILPAGVRDRDEIANYIETVPANYPEGEQYIIAASNHYGTSHFLDEIAQTGKLKKKAERLYQIIK